VEHKKQAQSIVDTTEHLPTLPDIIIKINALIDDPYSTADDLNKVISSDISLTSKMLKIVNSSFYGFSRNISSVTHAVVILGFNTVRNIALSAFLFDNLTSKALKPLWEHSITTGALSKAIGVKVCPSQAEEAFISGLLHDIGRVVFFLHDAETMIKLMKKSDSSFVESETANFGITQQEVGACLLDKWQLPESLIEAALYCNNPLQAHTDIPYIVNVANSLSKEMDGLSAGLNPDAKPIESDVLKKLGLTSTKLDDIKPVLIDAVKNSNVFSDML